MVSFANAIKLLMLLPGKLAQAHRSKFAQTLCQYYAGDAKLKAEIDRNAGSGGRERNAGSGRETQVRGGSGGGAAQGGREGGEYGPGRSAAAAEQRGGVWRESEWAEEGMGAAGPPPADPPDGNAGGRGVGGCVGRRLRARAGSWGTGTAPGAA